MPIDGCQREGGGNGAGDYELQTSGYKITKPRGCGVQQREYNVNNIDTLAHCRLGAGLTMVITL